MLAPGRKVLDKIPLSSAVVARIGVSGETGSGIKLSSLIHRVMMKSRTGVDDDLIIDARQDPGG